MLSEKAKAIMAAISSSKAEIQDDIRLVGARVLALEHGQAEATFQLRALGDRSRAQDLRISVLERELHHVKANSQSSGTSGAVGSSVRGGPAPSPNPYVQMPRFVRRNN
jgi:outer membrane PBP1 activator LpoA protein